MRIVSKGPFLKLIARIRNWDTVVVLVHESWNPFQKRWTVVVPLYILYQRGDDGLVAYPVDSAWLTSIGHRLVIIIRGLNWIVSLRIGIYNRYWFLVTMFDHSIYLKKYEYHQMYIFKYGIIFFIITPTFWMRWMLRSCDKKLTQINILEKI